MMSRKFRSIVFVMAYLFCTILAGTVYAEEPQTGTPTSADQNSALIDSKIAEAEKRVDDKIIKAVDAKFNATISKLENQAEKHVGSMDKLYEAARVSFDRLVDRAALIIQILIGLMTILVFIGFYIFGRSKKSLHELTKEQEEDFTKKIESLKLKFQKRVEEVERNAQEVVDNVKLKSQEIQNHYKNTLDSLTEYKKRKTIWCYENDTIDASEEIGAIRKQGFIVNEVKPGQEKTIANDPFNLVIYSFCKSDKSIERITEMVKFLKSTGRDIPCIIYTYNQGDPKFLTEENKILKEYKNFVMANMPLTLRSQFVSLIQL